MQENTTEKTSSKRRISGLDAIRTLAIGGVTFFHMFPDAIKGGYLGVSLFFVLTGFLLAYTTSKQTQKQSTFNVLSYYWKRILRIYPELLLTVFVTVGAYFFLLPKSVAGIFQEICSVFLGYNNWWQIMQNADYFARITSSSPFTHLWFLGIELQYYFIWPILYLIYRAVRNSSGQKLGLGLLGVLAVASASLMPLLYNPEVDVTRLYYGTDTRVYALLLGAIMGLYLGEGQNTLGLKPLSKKLFVPMLVITLVAYVLMSGQASFTYQGGMLLMTLLFCVLLWLVVTTDIGAKLEHPVCKFFGKYSYGIFLWQYPVIYLFGHMPWGKWPGSAALQLVLICVLAVLSNALCDAVQRYLAQGTQAAAGLPKDTLLEDGSAQCGSCGSFKDADALGKLKKLVLACTAVVCVVLMGFGAKAFVDSYGYKDLDKAQLQEQLKANAEKLAAENAAAAKAAHEQKVNAAQGQVDLSGVVCIGDSVMLGSSGALRKELPGSYIDAAVSRYVGDGVQIAEDLKAQGKLGQVVLIHLGTNGPIAGHSKYEEQTKKLLEVLGPDRDIFWVNFYCPETTWQDTNNAYLSNEICGYHSNVHLINWYDLVHNRPELLVSDRIHPSSEGIKLYGKLVRETMVRVLAEKKVKAAQKRV